jgi:23S rRNA (cytidine1920-2'-O)/16S rRNA (cytidine1409-2'-O)-methyltransferase
VTTRKRLDRVLVDRDLAATRSQARHAILLGQVAVDGATVWKPGLTVPAAADIVVDPAAGRYVGRGGFKLEAALDRFAISIEERTAVDVGASTGGFTDVLLWHGARRVAAVDVGHDQLHPSLREDERVDVFEGVNIRDATPAMLGGPFDVVVVDLSFISLALVADRLAALGHRHSDWVLLVKPQFEVGRAHVGKDGVVRSADARGTAVTGVAAAFERLGLLVRGVVASPITGTAGNREALMWMRCDGEPVTRDELIKVLADE